MRSAELNLDQYDTDKVRRLERTYDPMLQPWVDKPVKLLELGVKNGGSLQLWRDYFPLGTIVGIDIDLRKDLCLGERIHVFEGSQDDCQFLSEVASKTAPEGFDIIIDDASHIGELTRKSFWHLFYNHLKTGGIYAIEDWGTGYLDDWPDGKSVSQKQPAVSRIQSRLISWLGVTAKKCHLKMPFSDGFGSHLFLLFPKASVPCHSYGMVGFVKELVDETCADAVTSGRSDKPPTRQSKFESVLITHSIVFVRKVD